MMAHTLMSAAALGVRAGTPQRVATHDPADVALPVPAGSGSQPLERTLGRRRSVRSYAPQPLSLTALSQLLWAAQGITATGGRRTAPSAGALYPLELHVVAARVEGLAPGGYRYLPDLHKLRPVLREVIMPALSRAAFSQQALDAAPAVVVIAAVEERTARKYGRRAARYVAFEAGAASQSLALQAVALGLGTVVIGAFDDGSVARALRLPAGERPLALMPIGPVG